VGLPAKLSPRRVGAVSNILEEITRRLNDYLENPQKIQVEWVRRMYKETLPRFLKEIEEAHVLQGGEDLSSRNFVEGVAALAHVGMYVLATEEKAPWEVEITLYQNLYDVFIHEMMLFEG